MFFLLKSSTCHGNQIKKILQKILVSVCKFNFQAPKKIYNDSPSSNLNGCDCVANPVACLHLIKTYFITYGRRPGEIPFVQLILIIDSRELILAVNAFDKTFNLAMFNEFLWFLLRVLMGNGGMLNGD